MPGSEGPTKMTARLVIFVVGTSAIYFGGAILGEGGLAAFLAHPPLIALALVYLVLLVASLFTQGNLSRGEREDRGNRWVIAALGGLGLLDAFVPAYTDRLDLWTIDGDTLRRLGVVLFAVGGGLRILPVFVLGRRFSGLVAIQQDHRLVTTGIYATIRHPSYLGLLVNALGWGLAFRAGAGIVLAALMLVPILARIRAEEALLADRFGAEYAAYRRRTWRLLPYLY